MLSFADRVRQIAGSMHGETPDPQAIHAFLGPSLAPSSGGFTPPVWDGPDQAGGGPVQTFDIAAGAITANSIAAHTITGDEIDADYVAANVVNVGGTVVIDSTGERITGGKLEVRNGDSVVIIDGTSNMFKIVTTGTLTPAAPGASAQTTDTVTVPTGLTVTPASQWFAEFGIGDQPLPYYFWHLATGVVMESMAGWTLWVAGNQTKLTAEHNNKDSPTPIAYPCRYYVFKEVAV